MNPIELDATIGPHGVLTVERLPLAAGQPVHVRIEPTSDTQDSAPRVLGLHAGAMTISDDFDEPLPDSFWLGESGGDEDSP